MFTSTLTLGASLSSHSNSDSDSEYVCMRDLAINRIRLNLKERLTSPPMNFTFTQVGVVSEGCDPGPSCLSCRCPEGSSCEEGWRNCSCACLSPLLPLRGQCLNPCQPNPCTNSRQCRVVSDVLFSCECPHMLGGPNCQVRRCGLGMFTDLSQCRRCPCDPEGVLRDVCDGETGECFCKVSSYNKLILSLYIHLHKYQTMPSFD